jgi:iron(III) transport system ATP-binding protein
MIEIRNLTKAYDTRQGRVKAVRGIDLEIAEHEVCVLLGPSGCGKTTTLRCVAGLERPDEGEIRLGGKTVFSSVSGEYIPTERRDIGMVFQSYALWPHMNVFQVVAYPLTDGRLRIAPAAVEERVGNALELVKLGGLERRHVTDLSGGQQQRVALARALVAEPQVLLMDEPLSNLDARLREEMRVEIKRLTTRLGLTTLYVTHDQTEALSLADRVCVMQTGVFVDQGKPDQVYFHPASRFSAEFVGHMIFVPCRVAGPRLVDSELGRVSCELPPGVGEGAAVTLAMRPEHIVVGAVDEAGALQVEGEVRDRLFQGDSVLCKIFVGSFELSMRLASTTAAAVGGKVALAFPADRWIVYPDGEGSQEGP